MGQFLLSVQKQWAAGPHDGSPSTPLTPLITSSFFCPSRELWERDNAIALKVEAGREATSVCQDWF